MVLVPMAEGGKWLKPPFDAPAVYVHPKQLDGHWKRLIGDGWIPIEDPRREEDQPQQVVLPVLSANEVVLQSKIDQLEEAFKQQGELIRQLLAQKSEQSDGSQTSNVTTDSANTHDDQRPTKRKSGV